ncbi:hypothetical protein AVEN_275137-1 [Araneus ventricosus]|uniref:Uncharacterized protein n=1 Tax=Araneus ventricosus TaxID=182803 RepID=A0A4Y2MIZ9_ARAVE|nr:hypothetical protein AVEN_275137-1 [Araneus ventricosus]
MPEISGNSTLLVTSMLNKETLISYLWSLDALGILDPSEKKKEMELQEEARDHFLSTVKVNEEGSLQLFSSKKRREKWCLRPLDGWLIRNIKGEDEFIETCSGYNQLPSPFYGRWRYWSHLFPMMPLCHSCLCACLMMLYSVLSCVL